MDGLIIVLYVSLTLGLLWNALRGKKKKRRNPLERIEELSLRQAQDLDEKNEILKELYQELYDKKKQISDLEDQISKVVDLTRAKSPRRRNNSRSKKRITSSLRKVG